jgi:hypothetical protein
METVNALVAKVSELRRFEREGFTWEKGVKPFSDNFLMGMYGAVAAYLATLLFLHGFMRLKGGEPFKLKVPLALWNLFLTVLTYLEI